MIIRLIFFITLFTVFLAKPVLAGQSVFDAVQADDVATLQSLIAGGADVNAKNSDGDAPLHLAVTYGYKDMADILLTHGADADALDQLNLTPLHRAAEFSCKDVAETLIAHHATVDAVNTWRVTPLHLAAWVGGINTGGDMEGVTNIITLLITNKANLEAKTVNGSTPFLLAANPLFGYGHEEIALYLLKQGAKWDVQDSDGNAAIHAAARLNQTNLLKALLDRGADVNLKGQYGETPLFGSDESKETADILIAHGANVSLRDVNGLTPLLLAARGTNGAVQSLVQHGAEVNARNSDGGSALHEAAHSSDAPTVSFLLDHKADVNAQDNHGDTPLHFAAANATDSVQDTKAKIDLLVKGGANVNAKDSDGNTPLHWADSDGVVSALLVHGADATVQNNDGLTPEAYRQQLQDNPVETASVKKTSSKKNSATMLKGHQRLANLLKNSSAKKPTAQTKATSTKVFKNVHAQQNLQTMQSLRSALQQLQLKRNLLKGYNPQRPPTQNATTSATPAKYSKTKAHVLDTQPTIYDAVLDDNISALQDLIANGANLNEQFGCGGETALECAAYNDYVDAAEVLLDHGALVNFRDGDGDTALHYSRGYQDMVNFLISRGADPNAVDNNGRTPAQYWQWLQNDNTASESTYSKKDVNKLAALPLQDRRWLVSYLKNAKTHPTSAKKQNGAANTSQKAKAKTHALDAEPDIIVAAMNEDLDQVQKLIDAGADVNARDENGWTPLFYAATIRETNTMLELLVSHGAEVKATDKLGKTALFPAVWDKCLDNITYLINHGLDVKAADVEGDTALHWVTSGNNDSEDCANTVNILIANGADVNVPDNSGNTPLHYAWGNDDVANLLISRGANPNALNKDGQTPAQFWQSRQSEDTSFSKKSQGKTSTATAILRYDRAWMAKLAKNYSSRQKAQSKPTGSNTTIKQNPVQAKAATDKYLTAAIRERQQIIRSLKLRGDNKTSKLVSPGSAAKKSKPRTHALDDQSLFDAVFDGDDLAKFQNLIANGANLNGTDELYGYDILNYTIFYDRKDMAEVLLNNGVDINAYDRFYLPIEVALGHSIDIAHDLAEFLINHGANVNAPDGGLGSPIHLAAYQGDKDSMEFLISHGADVNARNWMSRTPLHEAADCLNAGKGINGIIEILISHGADVNARDESGATALHFATQVPSITLDDNSFSTVEDAKAQITSLLTGGANVNAPDNYGNTPLHWAENDEVIAFLIANGANPNAVNNAGQTPEQYRPLHEQQQADAEIGFWMSLSTKNVLKITAGVSLTERLAMMSVLKNSGTHKASANRNPIAAGAGAKANSGSLPVQGQKASKQAAAAEKKAKIQSLVRAKSDDNQVLSLWDLVVTDNSVEQIEVLLKTKDGQLAAIRYGWDSDTNPVILEKNTVSLSDVKSVTLNSYPDGQKTVKVYTRRNAVTNKQTVGGQPLDRATTDMQMNFPPMQYSDDVVGLVNGLLEQQKR